MGNDLVNRPTRPLPLEGMRIIDLTQAWAGSFATCLLGDMGAEVIKIEARDRMDIWRGPASYELAAIAPNNYLGSDPGKTPYNRSSLYQGVNRNKKSLTLNLSTDEGASIFKQLVRIGHVVTENFTPRVMSNFGLSYETLKKVNPSIIMLSMPAYGTTGPYKDCRGVGGTIEPMSGMSSLMGYDDGPPMNHGPMYPDPIAGMMAASAILIAFYYRLRTGKGQFIDISQQETCTSLLVEALMDFSMNGKVREHQGNRHQFMAPHNNYRCRGEDEWIAISISSDEEWCQLVRIMGEPSWSRNEKFATPLARLHNADELNHHLEQWTMEQDKYELMHRLQHYGVAAGVVLPTRETVANSHLNARGYIEELDYGEAGKYKTPSLAWKMSATPGTIWRTAPELGQDSETVLTELLGMDREEYQNLVEKGITGEGAIISE